MSKVSEIFKSIQDNDKCLIIYDESSIDSIFGAGILKFICSDITDVDEDAECINLFDEPTNDILSYANVTYVGCIPSADIIFNLANHYGSKLLFISCKKNDVSFVKSITKKASIEYSDTDSCALNLYKIAFGEFEDKVPSIITTISDGAMHKYNNTYSDYLKLYYGIYNMIFDSLYEDIISKICDDVTIADADESIEAIKTEGDIILDNNIDYICANKSMILKDKWTVNNLLDAYVIFSAGPISEDIVNKFNSEVILNIYKENDLLNVEMFNVEHLEYQTEINTLTNEIEALNVILQENPDDVATIKERINKQTRINLLSYIVDFDCGRYLAKSYKGIGSKDHGFMTITYSMFEKMMKNKAI